jgi:pimeloyl-ACP methyl ester carboxylesterase
MTLGPCYYQDYQVIYEIIGKGKPIVLIHGFGEDAHIWSDLAQSLAKTYKVIIPHLPGCGQAPAYDNNQNSLDNYAGMILAVVKHELIDQFVVVGHSMGGYIALSMAEQSPIMIKGLGLFHSTAFADNDEKKAMRKRAINFIGEHGAMAFLKTSIPGLFADSALQTEAIEMLLNKSDSFSNPTLQQFYEAMINRPDRSAVLRTAHFPVLLVVGLEDKAVPFSQSLQQSHLPAVCHLSVLRKSGHMGMLEEPEKSLLILTDYLQAIYV